MDVRASAAGELDEQELAEWLDRSETIGPRIATNWRDELICNAEGKTKTNLFNATLILQCHERWQGVIVKDCFADVIMKANEPPWDALVRPDGPQVGEWSDEDTSRAKAWLSNHERLEFELPTVEQAVALVASKHGYHPVREYLASLKWDGKARLLKMLPTYFCTDDNAYTQGIGKRWMISAIARIMRPGCKADCVLVLEGPQGYGKTTALQSLMKDERWYADTGINIGEKDSFQALRNKWIYCLDELDSLRRNEVTKTKSFISAQSDRYRPSFARRARDFPRCCVFAGTTNEAEYLVDVTGNRRFWPVTVKRPINWDLIRNDRDQLWAEAMVCYKAGERWHVDSDEFRKLCSEAQAERVQEDPWTRHIALFMTSPKSRSGMPLKLNVGEGVTTSEILEHALDMHPAHIKPGDSMRVAKVLRTLGYERGPQRREGNAVVRRYIPVSPLSTVTTKIDRLAPPL